MVCAHCRTENPLGSMHCFNCGRDISKSTAEPIEPAPVRDLLPQISTTENWDSLVIWTGGSGYEEEPIYGRADYWDIEAA